MTEDIKAEAFDWVKKHRAIIIKKFCDIEKYPSYEKPSILFMAGSPGAGKTEYSKSLIEELQKKDFSSKFVRIDADEIRKLIPQFNGKNSFEVQRAASKGVSVIYDKALKNRQNIILDGTFANFKISRDNVERALKRTDKIGIFYLYQEPILAWQFTQAREEKEGRKILKEVFIDAFLNSKKNVNLVKEEFLSKVDLNLIIQNRDNGVKKIYFNIDNIDYFLKNNYNRSQLKKIIG